MLKSVVAMGRRRWLLAIASLILLTVWYWCAFQSPQPIVRLRFEIPSADTRDWTVSGDGRSLLLESSIGDPRDRTARIQRLDIYELPSGRIRSSFDRCGMELSPDGRFMLMGDELNRNYCVYDLPQGHPKTSVHWPMPPGNSHWSKDMLYWCQWDGVETRVYETRGWSLVNRWPNDVGAGWTIPNGIVDYDHGSKTLNVWQFGSDQPIAIKNLATPATEVVESTDGQRLAVLLEDHRVAVWSPRTGDWTETSSMKFPAIVYSGEIHPHFDVTDSFVLKGIADNGNGSGGWASQLLSQFGSNHPGSCAVIDPSGKRLAVFTGTKVTIHDVETLKQLGPTYYFDSPLMGCPISPDGAWGVLYYSSTFRKPRWLPDLIDFSSKATLPQVIRLSDGRPILTLPDNNMQLFFTMNSQLWTIRVIDCDQPGITANLVEQWSLEPEGFPIWLWTLSAIIGVWITCDIWQGRRRRNAN